ncbi:bifunctional pyr operon transcriptional regulator/uracil phosphoribosyltransferase PyrR [bacterium]|nr:bifunctional pyr operon transcriptional regulator/uracil phosphoribosyltransferase PyrR [bacterium]
MSILLKENQVADIIGVMAKQISAKVSNLDDLALVGIRSRGVPLAESLAKKIGKVPVGALDITLYRDDLSRLSEHPVVKKTEINFALDDKTVFLVDDVLYTGRTIRAALDALFDFGRPKAVYLAVLIDRGGRELPIEATVVGKVYDVEVDSNVKVNLLEVDGKTFVELENK